MFVEDPVREEAFHQDIPILRRTARVPIAAGEEWGNRWDFNRLVEAHDIDYVRATLPKTGGITEMMKIAAILRDALRRNCAAFHRPSGRLQQSSVLLGTFPDRCWSSTTSRARPSRICRCVWISRMASCSRTNGPGLGVEFDPKPCKLLGGGNATW
jgi:L-alanine-DL-glutamate epimerase-like enolase superfamily enzyme